MSRNNDLHQTAPCASPSAGNDQKSRVSPESATRNREMCRYGSALAGEGWGGGGLARSLRISPPTLTLQPKSDVSDFGQPISGRTQVNLSSAASGGGNAPSVPRGLCINLIETCSSRAALPTA